MIVSNSDPPSKPVAAMTAVLSVFGLMGATFTDLLDRGYDITTALSGMAVVGVVATAVATWLLAVVSLPAGPDDPHTPAVA